MSAIKSAWSGSSSSASARAEQKPEHLVLAHHSAFKKGLGERCLIPEMAERYHAWQTGIFADTDADLVTAITMTNIQEAVGIARAAQSFHIPAVISFTVETDGRLPTGDTLEKAITAVDQETDGYPVYFMINCAHPTHFHEEIRKGGDWTKRLLGPRANASRISHEELDNASVLDAGDPDELGKDYRALLEILPHACVLGGCCGTDHRHTGAICRACLG